MLGLAPISNVDALTADVRRLEKEVIELRTRVSKLETIVAKHNVSHARFDKILTSPRLWPRKDYDEGLT